MATENGTFGASAGTFKYVFIPQDASQPCSEQEVSFATFEEKVNDGMGKMLLVPVLAYLRHPLSPRVVLFQHYAVQEGGGGKRLCLGTGRRGAC